MSSSDKSRYQVGRTLVMWVLLGLALAWGWKVQAANGITSPRDNAVVRGQVVIEGTASDPSFLRYELSFLKEFDPLGDWVVFFTSDKQVVSGMLAVWDTSIGREAGSPFYPDGTYRLRLRVVRQDSNYDEYYVLGLSLANESAALTPTVTPTEGAELAPSPTSAVMIPTELPTLTPFPSTTPRPTPSADDSETPDTGTTADSGGTGLRLEGQFDTARVKGGLLTGVRLALASFALLAVYVVVRGGLRRSLAWLGSRRRRETPVARRGR